VPEFFFLQRSGLYYLWFETRNFVWKADFSNLTEMRKL